MERGVTMLNEIYKSMEDLFPEMVKIRRYLHQYPELSFHETQTAKFIQDYYETLGIPYKCNVGGNGVIATLEGGRRGKIIALRADFDALPIQDEKDVPYKSKVNGVMHACGHDGHTAILLIIAKVLKTFQDHLPGTVVFLHQHAEEIMPGGAKSIVQSGQLNHIDAIFGTHLWSTSELGVIQTSKNVFMAGTDRFELTIHGKGGHGAYPHETKDAIVIATNIISQFQEIISRRIHPLEPAVITIGEFKAGSAFNVVADQAFLTGTVRYLDPYIQEKIIYDMEQIIKGVCFSNNVSYTLNYERGYPPLVNHEEEASLVLNASGRIEEVRRVEEVKPQMGGEDFAYYLIEKPGAFFFTGAQKKENSYPHHHPKFDIDERGLIIAAKALVQVYFDYQSKYKYYLQKETPKEILYHDKIK
jgi:amidohydrolase